MEYRVELRPHVGERAGKFGFVKVRHGQDLVLIHSPDIRTSTGTTFPNGLLIGYAGHGQGSIEFLPYAFEFEEYLPEICEEVGRLTGYARVANLPPKPVRVDEETGARIPDLDEEIEA